MSEVQKRYALKFLVGSSLWFSLVVFVGYYLNHLDRWLINSGLAFIWLFATPKGMGVLHIPTLLFTVFCLAAGVFSFMWGPQLILWGLTQMFSPPDDGEEEEDDDSVRNFEQL